MKVDEDSNEEFTGMKKHSQDERMKSTDGADLGRRVFVQEVAEGEVTKKSEPCSANCKEVNWKNKTSSMFGEAQMFDEARAGQRKTTRRRSDCQDEGSWNGSSRCPRNCTRMRTRRT